MPTAIGRAIETCGARVLCLADELTAGLTVKAEAGGEFYGLTLRFSSDFLQYPPTYADAVEAGLVSQDFDAGFYGRACRIGASLRQEAQKEGTPFFNGPALRLLQAKQSDSQLHLYVQPTSYFTMVGTNLGLSGYLYPGGAVGEPPLLRHNWGQVKDWQAGLETSRLANVLALHQIVHNDQDIFYFKRVGVTVERDCYQSVAGVIEGLDMAIEADRELMEEMGVLGGETRWLGLTVSLEWALPSLQGITHIDATRDELTVALAIAADRAGSTGLLHHIKVPRRASQLRRATQEVLHGQNTHWSPSGASGLLLALAHLCGEGALEKALG